MIDPHQIANMRHRARDRLGVGAANRAFPIADADNSPGRGDSAYLVVRDVAVLAARRLNPAMRGNHRTARHAQQLGHAFMAEMRDVDDHPPGLHP